MNAEARLARYGALFEAGRRSALLDALALCASTGTAMPPWLASEYLRIHGDVLRGQQVDLNDELGFTLRDPRVRHRRHLIATRGAEVGNAILVAHRAGRSIDTKLLEEIGAALGLSLRQVRDCWDACRAEAEALGFPPLEVGSFSGLIRPR